MNARFSYVLLAFALMAPSAYARKKPKTLMDQAIHKAETAMAKTPIDQEVCFAPDEPCDAKLVKFIASAQKSLDVAIFDINLDQVAHEILAAAKRGVTVRVLVDRRQSNGKGSSVELLAKGGIPLKVGVQRGIMHNKFTIVDGKMIETGSFNYTNGAAFNNNENQVYLANAPIVERYKRRFEQIWTAGKPVIRSGTPSSTRSWGLPQ